jgi:hypothetical protein
MRRFRGPGIFAVVCLRDVFMNTRFGGRQRPHFEVQRWVRLGDGGGEPLAISGPTGPLPENKTAETVTVPSAKEVTGDEVRSKQQEGAKGPRFGGAFSLQQTARRDDKEAKAMSVPYASATSGNRAREEVLKILRRFGCEKAGFMDDNANHEVVLYFEHRGRPVRLTASAKGWATMWLKENPRSYHSRKPEHEYRQQALGQGHLAVSSILRDWIKGQVTAIETGILSFEAVFMPFMLTADGRPLLERARDLLPPPAAEKVIPLR